jgi:hypothetical protein
MGCYCCAIVKPNGTSLPGPQLLCHPLIVYVSGSQMVGGDPFVGHWPISFALNVIVMTLLAGPILCSMHCDFFIFIE